MTDRPNAIVTGLTRVAGICGLALCSMSFAGVHPARLVPGNAAAFLVFPHMAESSRRVGEVLNRIHPDFSGFDLSEFEMTAGFAPGTIDLAQPIVVIADRPEELMRLFSGKGLTEGDLLWPVIGFTPAAPEVFAKSVSSSGRETGGVGTVVGAFGRYRIVMRDGMAFVATKGNLLARIARLSDDRSAWAGMSQSARDDVIKGDVFIQLSMSAWRPLFDAKLRAVTEVMKVGMQLQQPDPKRMDQTRKLADWFFAGVLDAVQQMETASASITFDDNRVRLSHHHTFRSSEWMADYLGNVRREGQSKPWRTIPDKPFLLGVSWNWNVPPDYCLSVRFNRKCMADPELCKTLSKEARAELGQSISTLTSKTSAEEFVVTSDAGRLLPLRIAGSYTTADAPRMLEVMQKVRDHSNEIVGLLIPGAAEIGGKVKLVQHDDMAIYQTRLLDAGAPQIMKDNIRAMYGSDPIYQEAAVNADTIVYSIGDRSGAKGLADVVREKAPGLAGNPKINKAMQAMPPDANVYLLVDTTRLVDSIPLMMRAQLGAAVTADKSGVADDPRADQVGPLLAWSATANGNHLNCAFTMKTGDLIETIGALKDVGRRLQTISGGGAPGGNLATERPYPFAMGE